jgi:hypothetical protein
MAGSAAHEYEVRDAIDQVVDASRMLLDTNARPVPRDQHPKQHGCVQARFVIGKNLESRYRQGLFQEPRVYEAWIRLSNGAQHDDRKPDAHGMAVKLMGVAGRKVLDAEADATTQDFLLVDNPTFIVRDALDYRGFSELLLKAKGKEPSSVYNLLGLVLSGPFRSFLTLLLLSLSPWRIFTFLRLIRFANKRIANPLTTRYWSTTPYRFGDTCMKFSAVPADFAGGPPAEGPSDDSYEAFADFLRPAIAMDAAAPPARENSPNYLREALARTLSARGAVFLFQVQLFKDDATTPIEDPTVEWPEDSAPFHTVGWIWVPKQVFDTPGRMAFGENLSFTPWHAIPAHEPLGEINLVRKHVYTTLSALRHRLNRVVPREPEVTDPDPTFLPPNWGDDPSAFWHVLEAELNLVAERRKHLEGLGSDHHTTSDQAPAAADASEAAKSEAKPATEVPADGGLVPHPPGVDERTKAARQRALREHTVGLALSGEGDRGATFSIGFLQGLGSLGLIRRLDYISAVSGGSRAAAWLGAWLKRAGDDPGNVERQLDPRRVEQARAARQFLPEGEVVDEEPQPVEHLRSHVTAPLARGDILSTGAWIGGSEWLGNVLIHALVLFPLLMLVATGARLVAALYGVFNGFSQIDEQVGAVDSRLGVPVLVAGVLALMFILLAGIVALWVAFSSIAGALREFRAGHSGRRFGQAEVNQAGGLDRGIVTPLWIASLLFSFGVPPVITWIRELLEKWWYGPNTSGLFSFRSLVEVVLPDLTILSWPNFLVHATVLGGVAAWWASRNAGVESADRRRTIVGASLAAGLTAAVLLMFLEWVFVHFTQVGRPDIVAMLFPAFALLIVVAAMVVSVALQGRAASDAERAWRAATAALLTRRAIGWLAATATIFYLPGLLYAAGGLSRAVITLAWLGAAAFALLVCRYVMQRYEGAHGGRLLWLASLASWVFFAGMLGACGLLVALFANMPSLTAPGGGDVSPFAYYLQGIVGTSLLKLIVLAVGFGLLYTFARRRIDVNLFSLGALNADWLTRAYVAASLPVAAWRRRWALPRDPRVITGAPALSGHAAEQALARGNSHSAGGVDSCGDLELRALCIGRTIGDAPVYWGPQLLFNTTTIATEFDVMGRHHVGAESFTLSPLYCGSTSVGYAPTENSARAGAVDPNLWLGQTAAVSASVSEPPASSTLRAFLTILSARPGSWIEKPRMDGWAAAGPLYCDMPAAASFGLDPAGGDFIYLRGGQEFESLGVYELIRRRCRYVIAVDASRDGPSSYARLGMLIRRCSIDFGIRIKIDGHPQEHRGPDGHPSANVLIGRIHYGDVDHGAPTGDFVYVTTAPISDDPPDTQPGGQGVDLALSTSSNSSRALDAEQFEQYRSLGADAARGVLGAAVQRLGAHGGEAAGKSHAEFVSQLFGVVMGRAHAPSTGQSEPTTGSSAGGRGRGRGASQSGPESGTSRRS